jgi:hypothetical protein
MPKMRSAFHRARGPHESQARGRAMTEVTLTIFLTVGLIFFAAKAIGL